MRYLLFTFIVVLFLSTSTSAQTRQQALQDIAKLKEEAQMLEKIVLSPDKQDIELAEKENANVFRILPREKYDNSSSSVRGGGGAYYSFTKQSNSYDDIPQMELSQDKLLVGFYGVNYGFITDLGKTSLNKIGEETKGFNFLIDYQPPTDVLDGRIEQQKARGFDFEGTTFKNRLPAKVGHSYLLRAITYDEADVFVALKIQRKDDDGSLIVFWKLIKQFDKPVLNR
jgi:hypothetical protein